MRPPADAVDEARKALDYFTANRQRMAYPKFRALGLCVTTGVVEGACKSVIGNRLKRSGMNWSVNGANAIICDAPSPATASTTTGSAKLHHHDLIPQI